MLAATSLSVYLCSCSVCVGERHARAHLQWPLYCIIVQCLVGASARNCVPANGAYCTLKAGCGVLYSSFLLGLPLRLYVIWPALQPRGAHPIRLAVLQCVPTDLMRSEWLTGLSLLPAVFSPPRSAHTCAQETHNLMRADCCFHLPLSNDASRHKCN